MSTLSLHLISLYLQPPNVGGVVLLCGGMEFNLACKLKATNTNTETTDVHAVVFWCRHAAWQFQATKIFPAVKTRVNAGIRQWKLHLSESTWCQESVGGICFTKKVKSSFYTTLDNFKPLLKRNIFKCISWLNGSFLGGEHRGFLKKGSQDLSNGVNGA